LFYGQLIYGTSETTLRPWCMLWQLPFCCTVWHFYAQFWTGSLPGVIFYYAAFC